MDYKLIKLKEGYIIVSNEEIENYYFNNHTKEIYLEIHPKRLEVTNKELNKEIIFKIIASTFIPQLPNIDFNNLQIWHSHCLKSQDIFFIAFCNERIINKQ